MRMELYVGAAKAEIEILRITAALRWPDASKRKRFQGPREIMHIVTRGEIESRDLKRICAGYGPRIRIERLQHLEGRTSFVVSGYDQDERELYEIPEVRRYFIGAFRRCPALIPAADLRNECFRIAILCVLGNLIVVRKQGKPPQLHVHEEELHRFFMDRLRPQATLHKRIGWCRTKGATQLQALADYLGIQEA
jgi:hypothetical protein